MRELEGYGVLVTGGSSGIGAGCAVALAQGGATVTICARTGSRLEDAARRIIEAAPGATVRTVVADVTDESQAATAVEAAAHAAGRLDGVVASAGGTRHIGPLVLADAGAVRETLELNVMGTLSTLKHAAPLLAEHGGAFVAVSSHTARLSMRFLGAYSASKAAVDQLVRVAADELGPAGVRVNSVRPGLVATESTADTTERSNPVLDSYLANTPLRHVGTVDEIGAVVRFLLGPAATWITGQCITIDGGQALRRGGDFTSMVEPMFGHMPDWRLVADVSPPADA